MKNMILVLSTLFCIVSCKKEDKYTIAAQSVSLYTTGTGGGADARNYSLVLKSSPVFTLFSKPVLYPDGHYEFSVQDPYVMEPGSAELFLYDSLEVTIDRFPINIPAPEVSKEDVIRKISFVGGKYIGTIAIRYAPLR